MEPGPEPREIKVLITEIKDRLHTKGVKNEKLIRSYMARQDKDRREGREYLNMKDDDKIVFTDEQIDNTISQIINEMEGNIILQETLKKNVTKDPVSGQFVLHSSGGGSIIRKTKLTKKRRSKTKTKKRRKTITKRMRKKKSKSKRNNK